MTSSWNTSFRQQGNSKSSWGSSEAEEYKRQDRGDLRGHTEKSDNLKRPRDDDHEPFDRSRSKSYNFDVSPRKAAKVDSESAQFSRYVSNSFRSESPSTEREARSKSNSPDKSARKFAKTKHGAVKFSSFVLNAFKSESPSSQMFEREDEEMKSVHSSSSRNVKRSSPPVKANNKSGWGATNSSLEEAKPTWSASDTGRYANSGWSINNEPLKSGFDDRNGNIIPSHSLTFV